MMTESEQLTSFISFGLFTILIFFFATSLAIRYRKRKKEHALLQAKYHLELQKVQLEIQEHTLNLISRELHDNLGHIASLVKINLNTIDCNKIDDADRLKIDSARDLIRQLITDLKLLSVSLGSHKLNHSGFFAAIELEVNRLNYTGVFHATIINSPAFEEPKGEKALILFRMIQEGIQNIIKHSKATEISLKLLHENNCSILELHDNGIGIKGEKLQSNEGAGLLNLRSRAELINAQLEIESSGVEGTTIRIRLIDS